MESASYLLFVLFIAAVSTCAFGKLQLFSLHITIPCYIAAPATRVGKGDSNNLEFITSTSTSCYSTCTYTTNDNRPHCHGKCVTSKYP